MVNFVSPGSYVIEKDFSEFAPSLNSSVAGVVGFAAQGEPNKAVLVTSASQLIREFGRPDKVSGGQAILAALEILTKTRSLYFVRAKTGMAADASANVVIGHCPAIAVSGYDGSSCDMMINIDVYDHTGARKSPNSVTYQLNIASGNLVAADSNVNGRTVIAKAVAKVQTSDFPFTFVTPSGTTASDNMGWLVGSWAGGGSTLCASAVSGVDMNMTTSSFSHYNDGATTGGLCLTEVSGDNGLGAGATASSITASGGHYTSSIYCVQSLYEGSGYNQSQTTAGLGGATTNTGLALVINSLAGKDYTLNLSRDGAVEESYSLDFESRNNGKDGNYPENVINVGEVNTVSQYVKGDFREIGGADTVPFATAMPNFWSVAPTAAWTSYDGSEGSRTPRFIKMIDGTYNLSGGVNGDIGDEGGSINANVKSALIGSAAAKTGMHALDDDSLNISMAVVPGIHEQSIQNALISLAENSQNFLAVVSPPQGLSNAQEAINWHNGLGDGRTASINSSYASIYWPHLKVYDPYSKSDVWMAPEAFAVATMAKTDEMADPWFAPAGLVRGRLTKPVDTEVILNQGDRDSMYQPGNSVNPITKFSQDGIVIFGQRTAQRTPTALDRINVRRMMILIRKMIMASTRAFVFEPNDPITWGRIETVLNPMLDDIRRRRGLTEFRVICDDTTNTPLRIDRNELWCRVLIKPTKTAEVLVFELNLTGQSSDLGTS